MLKPMATLGHDVIPVLPTEGKMHTSVSLMFSFLLLPPFLVNHVHSQKEVMENVLYTIQTENWLYKNAQNLLERLQLGLPKETLSSVHTNIKLSNF